MAQTQKSDTQTPVHIPDPLLHAADAAAIVRASRELGLHAHGTRTGLVIVEKPGSFQRVTFSDKNGQTLRLSYRAIIVRAIAALLASGLVFVLFRVLTHMQ